MSLDIRFTQRKNIVCHKCGEIVTTIDVNRESSGGSVWYPFLEAIGYYVPYEERTEENDWYGKDMVLTKEQAEYAYRFIKGTEVYGGNLATMLIAEALLENNDIVVNADW